MYYWWLLKSGSLRCSPNKPARPHIVEQVVKDTTDPQHQSHLFTASLTGRQAVLQSWCGWDRGPGREKIIRDLFQ